MQGFHQNEELQECHFWQSPLPISIPLESPETSRNLWGTDKTLLYTLWAFAKPVPVPVKTHTPGHRYRFSGVPVQVALENPRITHANPYSPHEY